MAEVNLPANLTGTSYNVDNGQTAFNRSSFTGDANGNLTNEGTNAFIWDARNHLSAISGGSTASFVYDAFGRRAGKSVNGTATQFLYDGLNPVQELQSGSPGANLLTGLNVDEYFMRTDSNGAMSFLSDSLGSTLALSTSAGAISTSYAYEPFGNVTGSGSSNVNSYQFTGRENDGTGLYYYRARYYSPTYQRFIAQDPIGLAGGDPNLYGYVGNAPTQLIDPTGQQAEMICELAPEMCEEAGEGLSALISALGAAATGAASLACQGAEAAIADRVTHL